MNSLPQNDAPSSPPVEILKAPFPWFGGKSRVAHVVWDRFGNTANYVEPFAGSLAVLLGRPHPPQTETVNDLDCYLSNFWRALHTDPEGVAEHADWPVNEADLHARHLWLVNQIEFRERMKTDPEFYDSRIAGWWVWGISQWIGSGWCSRPEWTGRTNAGRSARGIHAGGHNVANLGPDGFQRPDMQSRGVHRQHQFDPQWQARPFLTTDGQGVHSKSLSRQLPKLSGDTTAQGSGIGVHQKRPLLSGSGPGHGVEALRCRALLEYFQALADRLRRVRVCCGDWTRVLGPSVTVKHGVCGIFLDPPYDMRVVSGPESSRDGAAPSDGLYSNHSNDVSAAVREWALKNGDNPLLRIALCGYQGEHAMPDSWECVAWKANGGYGSQGQGTGRKNAARERIWFSRHCLQPGLFGLSQSANGNASQAEETEEESANV